MKPNFLIIIFLSIGLIACNESKNQFNSDTVGNFSEDQITEELDTDMDTIDDEYSGFENELSKVFVETDEFDAVEKIADRNISDQIRPMPEPERDDVFKRLYKRLSYLSDHLDVFFKRFLNLPKRWQEKLKDVVVRYLKHLWHKLENLQERLENIHEACLVNDRPVDDRDIIRKLISMIEEIQEKIERFVSEIS